MLSAANNFTHRAWFVKNFLLLELLWLLPSLPTNATALKSVSGFPDTLQCPKTLFPDSPVEGFQAISLSLLYPVCLLQRCETEKMEAPPATLPPSSTHL